MGHGHCKLRITSGNLLPRQEPRSHDNVAQHLAVLAKFLDEKDAAVELLMCEDGDNVGV